MKDSFNSAFRVHLHFFWLIHHFSNGGKRLLFAIALLATWSAASLASEPEGCAEQGLPPAAASVPTEGLKAYIDPETGELLTEPPPGEAEAPDSPATAPVEPEYATETRPDGTLAVDLSERPPEELQAEVVDGKLVFCHRSGSAPSEPEEK